MLTRLLSILVTLGVICSASGATAATPGGYLELAGFGTWLDDSENKTDAGIFNASYDAGMGGSLALGYDLGDAHPSIGQGRLELEAASRRSTVNNLAFVEGRLPVSGDVKINSLMFTTIADYHGNNRLVPYVSLGIGYAEVSIDPIDLLGSTFIAGSKDGVLACQLGAGLGVEIGEHLAVDLGYRYFGTQPPKFKLVDGSNFTSQISSHNVLLGLRIKF